MAVATAADMARCGEPLAGLGYAFMGDPAGQGEAFYALGPDEARTHYLHLLPATHPHWPAYLRFRDALRADPQLRDRYNELKLALAGAYPAACTEYTARKTDFIERVLQGAPGR